jgi:hypothetical protein
MFTLARAANRLLDKGRVPLPLVSSAKRQVGRTPEPDSGVRTIRTADGWKESIVNNFNIC